MPRILVLVPTPFERQRLMTALREHGSVDADLASPMLCGFGPIAAAARTAGLIAQQPPDHVLLIGIAGTFDPAELPVGTACQFTDVACHGIGVGSGPSFLSAWQMGWPQFVGQPFAGQPLARMGGEAVLGDCLSLQTIDVPDVRTAGLLVTCCAASADERDANERRQRFPDAMAEDMEGFGVAMACAMAGVPLCIVRGISNRVGDRDRGNWRVDAAIAAAADMTIRLVRQIEGADRG
jgi:futalosine hydrolase